MTDTPLSAPCPTEPQPSAAERAALGAAMVA